MLGPSTPGPARPVARVLAALLAALALASCSDAAPAPQAPRAATPPPAAAESAPPEPEAEDAAAADARVGRPPPEGAVAEPTAVVVVIDPGHGGDDIGAAANGIVEKESNLDMALRVEPLLREAGIEVVLTRRDDSRALAGEDLEGFRRNRRDRQARTDTANEAGAAVFVSIHSNGIDDRRVRGLETYYNSERTFAEENRALATAIHSGVLEEAAEAGWRLVDRGVRDSTCIYIYRGNCYSIFVIAPERVTTRQDLLDRGLDPERVGFAPGQQEVRTRPTQMPGALVELLFVSNPDDAALLAIEPLRDAMARGIAAGILAYLAEEGIWPLESG